MDIHKSENSAAFPSPDYLRFGLSSGDVKKRIQEGKINGNDSIRTKSIKRILFDNVCTLFNLVNLILAICVLYVHSYKNMLFMCVVFWNIFIGTFQEIRSKRIIDRLSLLTAPNATVLRGGKKETIELSAIVLDDLMLLSSGNQICADACLVEGSCEVNESLLTGENEPVIKQAGDTLYSGSFLVSGKASARVIHVGKDNYVSQITGRAKYVKKANSEMLSSIKKIIKIISICLIPVTALLFYNQITMPGNTFEYSVVSTVAAVIGMIPSGLVLLISMVLAVSTIKLARKNTLVQELYCIENLSRVDTLCLDKTGTLTEGTMHLEDIVPLAENDFSAFQIKTMLYHFSHSLEDNNSTFLAIKERCEEIFDKEAPTIPWEIHSYLSFSSARKWSMVDFESKGCFVIGAYEFIFPELKEELLEKSAIFTKKGMRVLAAGYSPNHCVGASLPKDLEPIAFLLLTDKIRPDAEETLSYFKKQGVDIKIISGDNPATVAYIAGKAGLLHADKYIDASTLADDEELEEASEHYSIFGRVTPDQKLMLVKSLQKHGHTVAMTGDGVNDVLALKEADCSIAMQSGSDAARNVAQIVLMDSKFSSMPSIVAEGRQTINNIQRSASLYLTKTIYSTILAFVFVFLNEPYPFVPIQTTLTGALTIGIPSFILALEPNINRIHGKFLANILRLAIPGGLLVALSVVSTEIFGILLNLSSQRVSTVAAYSLFIASATELFKVCTPFNTLRKYLFGILIGIFFCCATFLHSFFGFTPLWYHGVLFILALIPICSIIFRFFDVLTENFLGTAPNVYKVHPCFSDGLSCMLVLNEVEKRDYEDVAFLMMKNELFRPVRIFFLYPPIRGGDVAVDYSKEEFEIHSIIFAAWYFQSVRGKLFPPDRRARRRLRKQDTLLCASVHEKAKKNKILVECPYYEKPVEVSIKINIKRGGITAAFDLPENEFFPDCPGAGHYEKRMRVLRKRKLTL